MNLRLSHTVCQSLDADQILYIFEVLLSLFSLQLGLRFGSFLPHLSYAKQTRGLFSIPSPLPPPLLLFFLDLFICSRTRQKQCFLPLRGALLGSSVILQLHQRQEQVTNALVFPIRIRVYYIMAISTDIPIAIETSMFCFSLKNGLYNN